MKIGVQEIVGTNNQATETTTKMRADDREITDKKTDNQETEADIGTTETVEIEMTGIGMTINAGVGQREVPEK